MKMLVIGVKYIHSKVLWNEFYQHLLWRTLLPRQNKM